jgi:hypothetical protein
MAAVIILGADGARPTMETIKQVGETVVTTLVGGEVEVAKIPVGGVTDLVVEDGNLDFLFFGVFFLPCTMLCVA